MLHITLCLRHLDFRKLFIIIQTINQFICFYDRHQNLWKQLRHTKAGAEGHLMYLLSMSIS